MFMVGVVGWVLVGWGGWCVCGGRVSGGVCW